VKEVAGGWKQQTVCVNLEGQSFRDWSLGNEEVASTYLYIARLKLDLLWRRACLIVLAMLNIWVVLPKDHIAGNKHRIHQSLGNLVLFLYMIIPFHCSGFLFQGFESDKTSLFALIINVLKSVRFIYILI
jgi:hypothetical protein